MPNRKTKEAMRANKRAAAQERDRAARKDWLEKEGTRLRAPAIQNDLSGKPSILSNLPAMSVRERKLQDKNKGLLSPSGERKSRVLSKHEILQRKKVS
jgi:hypothetical protein